MQVVNTSHVYFLQETQFIRIFQTYFRNVYGKLQNKKKNSGNVAVCHEYNIQGIRDFFKKEMKLCSYMK